VFRPVAAQWTDPPFQQPERVLGFFNTYREAKRVTRKSLTEIADQLQY
jgi:hypothetical protein